MIDGLPKALFINNLVMLRFNYKMLITLKDLQNCGNCNWDKVSQSFLIG